MFDLLINNLFWRNTKESVKTEYSTPSLSEDLVLLDLTDIESALYKHLDENKYDEYGYI